jgi:hypothetical protein
LDEKKSDEYSADDGPDAFKNIDLSNRGGVFFDVLRIESTPVSEEGTLRDRYRKKDKEGGAENWPQAQSFSGSEEEEVSEYPGEINGPWKGGGKKKLEEHKDFYSALHFFLGFGNDKGTDGYQDEPVGENDSEGKLVPVKRNEELPHQDDLGHDTAHALNEERDFEGLDVDHQFWLRSDEFGDERLRSHSELARAGSAAVLVKSECETGR